MKEIRLQEFEMKSHQYDGQIATINLKGIMPMEHAAPFLKYINSDQKPNQTFRIKCYLELI